MKMRAIGESSSFGLDGSAEQIGTGAGFPGWVGAACFNNSTSRVCDSQKIKQCMPTVFRHKAVLFPSGELALLCMSRLFSFCRPSPGLLSFQPLQDYITPPCARWRLLRTRAPVHALHV